MFDMPDVAGVFCPAAPESNRRSPGHRGAGQKPGQDKEDPPEELTGADPGNNGGVTQESAVSGKRHLPALDKLIESGKVLALNMPAGSNPALARAIGVMLKNAWLQALLRRPKQMKEAHQAPTFGPRSLFVTSIKPSLRSARTTPPAMRSPLP